MKHLLYLLLLLLFLLLVLPTSIVLCLSPKKADTEVSAAPTFFVKNVKSGEIEEHNLESYLIGVLAAEMPASFHDAALRAQATAARTYIYNKMKSGEKNSEHPDAVVCTDSAHCKAWLSDADMQNDLGADWYKNYHEKLARAVSDTQGEIITYDDEPIVAVFHSTGSGRTENAKDVWGGDLPYLKSVASEGDKSSPKFTSTAEVSKEDICKTLSVTDAHVYDCTRTEGGAVDTVNIGGFLFRGTDIRAFFDLNSANFTVEETENAFIFHVVGNGHGVGLSQYGANAMAENGSDHHEILSAYYTGVSFYKAW